MLHLRGFARHYVRLHETSSSHPKILVAGATVNRQTDDGAKEAKARAKVEKARIKAELAAEKAEKARVKAAEKAAQQEAKKEAKKKARDEVGVACVYPLVL